MPYARILIAGLIGAVLLVAADKLLNPSPLAAFALLLAVLLIVGSWATWPLTHQHTAGRR